MKPNAEPQPAATANLTISIEINASLERTWKAMIEDIGKWWRSDFLVCENSQGMQMEPHAGGKIFETTDNGGGFVWGSIISFQPAKHLAYVAQIVPPWGGPAQSVVQLGLVSNKTGSTSLTLTDSLIGHLTEDSLGCIDEGC